MISGLLFRKSALAFLVALFALQAWAQKSAAESGKFILHKMEQPIGEETYTIKVEQNVLVLSSDFLFTDRGSQVPLTASLRATSDYRPQRFVIKGKTSRETGIDAQVDFTATAANVRQGTETREVALPQSYFAISGYSPVAMQMALMRYWLTHGRPSHLAIFPSGNLQIQDRGAESFPIDNRSIKLERYNVRGLIWGMETLWMDASHNLAGLVSTDAEFDHFEAVREEYEPALKKFVASAARDQMEALTELSRSLPGRRSGTFAFVHGTLIDGTGRPAMPDTSIVTRDGKIVSVGPSSSVQIPKDAQLIDVTGKYIIPGLWDMHAHYEQVEWGPIYLAAGVTTVRDVGNEFEFIKTVRDAVNSGNALGPHMLLAGIVDGDSPMAIGVTRVNSAADAQAWVTRYHDAGFQQMKIYSSVKPDVLKAVCADAHQVGMSVTGHIPNGLDAFEGVEAGMDQINHISYVVPLYRPKDFNLKTATDEQTRKVYEAIDVNSDANQQIVAFFKQHGTVLDPTVALFEFIFRPADRPASSVEPGIAKVAPELRQALNSGGAPPEKAATQQLVLRKMLEVIGAMHRAGVPIVAGTDQTVPGYSVYREIELYAQSGFTPMEALQAATLVPAQVMQVARESGTVEAGKRADFDILSANPLENIHNIRSVQQVVANGVVYDPAPLWTSVGFTP
ncbi:MAG TPA: amidohydrolase family protein [Terriglobales bacterium]|nr:amidohydrolase family protein [Terriglobales bacterium]